MKEPLVSIIVPTRNSAATLENCLKSIKAQSYQAVEVIVVDNFSDDNTLEIANKYTNHVFQQGPERSAQRNFGAQQARGEFVVMIDSDMELTSEVIGACVAQMQVHPTHVGVVIPEESFGEGFWASCKRLERSYYVGVAWMEAARFFRKSIFEAIGGYNQKLVSGEDWDVSQRAETHGPLARIDAFILHNEGQLSLFKSLRKKFYYARQFAGYKDENPHQSENVANQTGLIARYKLFFTQPQKIAAEPHRWLGMLLMKTAEFGFGGLGYISARMQKSKAEE